MDRPQAGGYNIYEIALAGMIDRRTAQSLILRERIIRITVQPTLAGLRGSDDRMLASMRVFASVSIWRAVAAERDATCLAGAQMNPVGADLHAFFAFAALRLLDRIDRIEMRAASVGHRS